MGETRQKEKEKLKLFCMVSFFCCFLFRCWFGVIHIWRLAGNSFEYSLEIRLLKDAHDGAR